MRPETLEFIKRHKARWGDLSPLAWVPGGMSTDRWTEYGGIGRHVVELQTDEGPVPFALYPSATLAQQVVDSLELLDYLASWRLLKQDETVKLTWPEPLRKPVLK